MVCPLRTATCRLRGATPTDGEALRRMFSRASSETIYLRFHTPYPDVPEWMLALMLDLDHPDKEFLLAVTDEEIVGHAMYVVLGDSGRGCPTLTKVNPTGRESRALLSVLWMARLTKKILYKMMHNGRPRLNGNPQYADQTRALEENTHTLSRQPSRESSAPASRISTRIFSTRFTRKPDASSG
jgi:hypothetical protein